MPVIAKFYGIVIRMFRLSGMPARFYAIYQDSELVIEIAPLRVVQSSASTQTAELVLKWAKLHQHELLAAWRAMLEGRKPAAIAPLN